MSLRACALGLGWLVAASLLSGRASAQSAPAVDPVEPAVPREAPAAPAVTEPVAPPSTSPPSTSPPSTSPPSTSPPSTSPPPATTTPEATTPMAPAEAAPSTSTGEPAAGTPAQSTTPPPAPPVSPAPPASPSFVAAGSAAAASPVADTGPGGDGEEPDYTSAPPRLPWRGTAFLWGHDVSTSVLGVGGETISDAHEVYVQSFSWVLNYFLVDLERFKLRVAVSPGFEVELTNSNTTTNLNEPQLYDLPVSVVGSFPLYQKTGSLWYTGVLTNLTVLFPLSEVSQGSGLYLTTSPRLLLFQSFPLFGADAAFLKGFSVGLSGRWDHNFSEAEFPVNGRIGRQRQGYNGNTFTDDALAGDPLAHDSLRWGAFVFLDEEVFSNPLWINGSFSMGNDYLYSPDEDYCRIVAGECIVPGGVVDPATVRTRTALGISATYFPLPELAVTMAYANVSGLIGPGGNIQNPLFSPSGARFSASLGIAIDAFYERLTGPKRKDPYLLVGQKKQRDTERTALTF